LRDDAGVKTARIKRNPGRRKVSTEVRVRGKRVPAFGGEFIVVRTGRFAGAAPSAKTSEEARFLVKKAGKALKRPGISKKAIFKQGRSGVFAYSVDSADPERIVRRSAAGKRTVGRLVAGRFRAG
jgi:hypothetical protein